MNPDCQLMVAPFSLADQPTVSARGGHGRSLAGSSPWVHDLTCSPTAVACRESDGGLVRGGSIWRRAARWTSTPVSAYVVGVMVIVVASVTLGLFSARATAERHGFTADTLTLTTDAIGACAVTDMAPGDPPRKCMLALTYIGPLSAYLALDVLIETKAGSGGTDLYNPRGSNGLTISITDNQGTPVTYEGASTATTCPSGVPSGTLCYQADNELIGTSAFSNGTAITVTIAASLPLAAGNGYQDGRAQVVLTAHAVQAKNNSLACTTTPTAGRTCRPRGSFAWS